MVPIVQLLSNFVLCRALISILQHIAEAQASASVPSDLIDKLEEMVFGQIRGADPYGSHSFRRWFFAKVGALKVE